MSGPFPAFPPTPSIGDTFTDPDGGEWTYGSMGWYKTVIVLNSTYPIKDISEDAEAAGNANEIQYNDGAGGLAASPDLTWDDTGKVLEVGGDISHALGTATAPSIAFTGDPNTGIFSPGADQVAVATNGAERLRITSAGLVGIGTSAPNLPLTVTYSDSAAIPTSGLLDETSGGLQIRNSDSEASFAGLYLRARTSNSANALIGVRYNTTFSDGDIFFKLRNAGSGSIEPLTIKASGRVGIGTSTPNTRLNIVAPNTSIESNGNVCVQSSTSLVDEGGQISLGVANARVASIAGRSSGSFSGYLQFGTRGTSGDITERARIDSSGRLLVGTSSALSTSTNVFPIYQQAGLTNDRCSQILYNFQNDGTTAIITFAKSRGGSVGAQGLVASTDTIGVLHFEASDGTQLRRAATIRCELDGTPTASPASMPGRLAFSTTADGASSPTERLRITNAGVLQVADAGNIAVGTTTGTKIGTATTQKIGFYNATPVVQPAAVADATDAATVITQLNDLLAKLRTLGIIAT